MNPWDEKWTLRIDSKCYPRAMVDFDDKREGNCSELWMSDERAHLAAAAPDLYRALADVEWIDVDDNVRSCPCCRSVEGIEPHDTNCGIALALRKARGET